MTELKLGLVIFIVGVSVIFSKAIDPSSNQFNAPQILESILSRGTIVQGTETNILTHRISNNVKDNSNPEVLGGYRPLFPPYFPLKTPFASKKLYMDQEYYTRGIDEFFQNENENAQNAVRTLPPAVVPLLQNNQIFARKSARISEDKPNFRPNSVDYSRSIRYLPSVIATQSNVNNKNQHEVTFITY